MKIAVVYKKNKNKRSEIKSKVVKLELRQSTSEVKKNQKHNNEENIFLLIQRKKTSDKETVCVSAERGIYFYSKKFSSSFYSQFLMGIFLYNHNAFKKIPFYIPRYMLSKENF